MISLEKLKKVADLVKLIVATSFEKLPKVQQIAQSGHIDRYLVGYNSRTVMFIR